MMKCMIKLSIAVKGIRLSMAMLSYNRMTVFVVMA